MFDLSVFLTAAGVGIAIAAPVGAMGTLCIRRTLVDGPRAGLAVGLGIACGDAAYGLVSALGMASVSRFMLAYDKPLHLLAGLFLLYLGMKTFFQKPGPDSSAPGAAAGGAPRIFASSFLLTLTNPQTIVAFAALFTSLAPHAGFSASVALTTVVGVFCGSIAWWCFLVGVVSGARHALGDAVRQAVDRVAGLALAVFGIGQIRRAI